MKYRLKKDTPFYKKGTEFCEDWFHKGVLLNDDCNAVANLNELDNPDEWFEEVKESGWWKPKSDEKYYFLSNVGEVIDEPWLGSEADEFRYSVGNVFKTKEAAERYRDYLKAIATVRQDEGVLTTEEARKQVANGNRVYCLMPPGTVRNSISVVAPGGIYFKDTESAGASWDAHRKEWQTILNYDWSRE